MSRSRSRSPWPGYHLGRNIERQVRAELARVDLPPLPAQQQRLVEAGYCLERHLRAFKIAVRVGSFSFSIRHSGVDTLECQDHRGPAKGHDIGEKTAKAKTLVDAYGEDKGRFLLGLLREVGRTVGHPLAGRVGHWSDDGLELLGFYMSPEINGWADSVDPLKKALYDATRVVPPRPTAKEPKKGDPKPVAYRYVAIEEFGRTENAGQLLARLQALTQVPDWTELVFSGDLDLFNLCYPGNKPVGEGSPDEQRLYHFLHMAIGAADPYRALDQDRPHMLLLPHGPQQNFGAFVKAHEPETGAPVVLTELDLPLIAFIDQPADDTVLVCEIADIETHRQYFRLSDSQQPEGRTRWIEDPDRRAGMRLQRRSTDTLPGVDATPRRMARPGSADAHSVPGSPTRPSSSRLLYPGRPDSVDARPTTVESPVTSPGSPTRSQGAFALDARARPRSDSGASLSVPNSPRSGSFGPSTGRPSRIPAPAAGSTPPASPSHQDAMTGLAGPSMLPRLQSRSNTVPADPSDGSPGLRSARGSWPAVRRAPTFPPLPEADERDAGPTRRTDPVDAAAAGPRPSDPPPPSLGQAAAPAASALAASSRRQRLRQRLAAIVTGVAPEASTAPASDPPDTSDPRRRWRIATRTALALNRLTAVIRTGPRAAADPAGPTPEAPPEAAE